MDLEEFFRKSWHSRLLLDWQQVNVQVSVIYSSHVARDLPLLGLEKDTKSLQDFIRPLYDTL